MPYNARRKARWLTLSEETAIKEREAKDARLEARTTRAQKALFEKAAAIQGVSLTDFILVSLQEAATRIVVERQNMRLTERDSRSFVKALLSPTSPGKRLKAAARRYKKRAKL